MLFQGRFPSPRFRLYSIPFPRDSFRKNRRLRLNERWSSDTDFPFARVLRAISAMMPSFREHNGRASASLSANSAKDYRPSRTFAPIMRLYLPEGEWGRPNVCFSLHGHVEACVPLIAHPWPIHFVMLVPRSRQRESKLVPHHNGCLPPPPTSRRNDHSGIDRSVCGRTASCAFAARRQ